MCVCVCVCVQLLADWVHSFQSAAGTVLSHGRRVVVYSGKDDFICNYLGGQAWINSTQWNDEVCVRERVRVCVCVRERESERGRESVCTCVFESSHTLPTNNYTSLYVLYTTIW